MDWKDALSSLKEELPVGEDKPQPRAEKIDRGPRLQVFYEKKGRAGKPATIITGYLTEQQAMEDASRLKKQLAVGGSARGLEVLLQGDQRERLKSLINK